ncbi:MAG: DUF499 domain-containing protein [Candidatus Poribacteria bacterium]|nr:DUF499 domain-containing protein [Candidatus Poribacteria bacterium]
MKLTPKPWHEIVQLRDDVRTRELSLAVFAADLYDVVMQKGKRPAYENPDEFFALTYPSYNLRELVKDVALRLARRSDKAYRTLSVNYGGGKTHTLITLKHLVEDPTALPELPAIDEFEAHIGQKPPSTRCAALCFDKIDLEKGVQTIGPDGAVAQLKRPWSVLAYQIAGSDGLRLLHADGKDIERDTPPAEPVLSELLSKPQRDNLSTLVLLDEVLMYLRDMVETDGSWRGRLLSFFQHLTSSVVKVDRCAMVASLRASDQNKHDDLGKELLAEVSDVFGRQMEETSSPISKEDVAEVLRRRFFKPESIQDKDTFRPQVTAVVRSISALDEETKKAQKAEEERYLNSYPFHPDLTETFYSRWTQLERFQRTRGILRTFATALRDAEKWDTGPLIGPNVFLAEPGKTGLTEAASELTSFASVDATSGQHQEWGPILEGELKKAATIQSETTGLNGREIEQAVITVFLSSQPAAHKALTPELMVLIGTANPDKIGLEKALRRWTELSWFLDEQEIGSGESDAGGAAALPKAWRLGNRPNLRQMHHAACTTRVPPSLIDSKIIEAIEKQKDLVSGASAAGAKVHKLPEQPRHIADDGEFHYAILRPSAVSESGKPSTEAKRFINATTAPDRPRVNRNAVVLAVPSKDGIEMARVRVREYLGWEEVRDQLKDQQTDTIRDQMLVTEMDKARRRIPDAIKQAYSIVVTVNESNEIHAFKVVVTDQPLFTTIKADKRARVQETAISAEAMMPGGPYDLWRDDEQSRRVKDLVGAFAQFPKLPKMLRSKGIMDTVVGGVQQGIWAAQYTRPDKTTKTFWHTAIDEHALDESGLEVLLPESATLSELPSNLLKHQELPGLWQSDEITVQCLYDYFAGGYVVNIPKDGYEEPLTIPKCDPAVVDTAVLEAVELGTVWLTSGPASILNEPVPAGVLNAEATLRPPPAPIPVNELMEEATPQAWEDGKTTALALVTALSQKRGATLPWQTVRSAIDDAIRAKWLALRNDSAYWPCDLTGAQHVVLQVPQTRDPIPPIPPKPAGLLVATADLEAHGIQDLADQIPDITDAAIGEDLKFNIRVEFGGETPPDPEAVEKINALLAEVSEDMKLE